jgi:hypothetical protein
MHTRLVLLGALLTPALAFAQPPDPYAPPPPPPPEAPQTTTTTTTTTQGPSVVVDPPPPVTVTPVPTTEPEYYEVRESYNAPMFTTGALVFAASYGASVVVAATSDDDSRGTHHLYVPVIGPWLALSDRGECDITDIRCDNETTKKVLLVADGVFQAAGVVGMIGGILAPTTRRVYTRSAKLDTKIRVRPTMIQGDPGVKVFGNF